MSEHDTDHDFHLVNPSPWPLLTSITLMLLALGGINVMHGWGFGAIHLAAGTISTLLIAGLWWKDVIKEAIVDGAHKSCVQNGLRIGMALFIFSEVMFFFTFFWSFFKAWLYPQMLIENMWPSIQIPWPPEGIETINAWDLPFINTLILLLSGTTVTWAHHSLLHDDGKDVVKALSITVGLGVIFTALQALEYMHAPFKFAEEGTKAIYSSNFYMATGFHGFHVLCGTIFLFVCLLRAKKGQLTKESHLGFEFAAWYWHFVDVVWLFLFVFVYWLGA